MQAHFKLHSGKSPLLVSIPHAGTRLPEGLPDRLTDTAMALPDTDWFVDQLYGWARHAGAGMIVAAWSRYVVDLNRPPDDTPLYESASHGAPPGLIPLASFDGDALYKPGMEPDAAEVDMRREHYWRPYHSALVRELTSVRERFGHAILLDAHSIRARVPALFEGRLPDLNLGSNGGASASPSLLSLAWQVLDGSPCSAVLDGRFKGGYITRHYGSPISGIHALQLELAQSCYMQERPPAWREDIASHFRPVLEDLVLTLMKWSPESE